MNKEKELSHSNDMPEPQVIQYYQTYRVTELFINDLKKTLGDMAYADTKPLIDKIEECERNKKKMLSIKHKKLMK